MSVRELREVKAALRAEREARELAEARAEKAEDDYGLMCDTLEAVRAQPPRTEYVADPNVSERLRKYEERYGDIDELGRTAFATNTQDLTASVMSFSRAVRDFAKRYAYMAQYSSAIVTLDPLTAREYTEAVSALRDLVSVFPNGQYARTDVIDADYNIIEGEY
ncbi:hypothetical protein ACIFQM_11040 [Paenibacillus sp. NRS-1782]|uniref:hypothetical protein n=1 Tax=Paenibacillus sp. NRS-1782 TaxID=3233906 RepID=UPI003D2B304A